MTIRGLLFLSGLIMIVLGLSFLVFPEIISKNIFQEANDGEIKIDVDYGGTGGVFNVIKNENITTDTPGVPYCMNTESFITKSKFDCFTLFKTNFSPSGQTTES